MDVDKIQMILLSGTNMNTLAEKENFLVLYPDMNRHFKPSDRLDTIPLAAGIGLLIRFKHRGKGHPSPSMTWLTR